VAESRLASSFLERDKTQDDKIPNLSTTAYDEATQVPVSSLRMLIKRLWIEEGTSGQAGTYSAENKKLT
jgi:hypothetical protein